jgi:hypothetical protein
LATAGAVVVTLITLLEAETFPQHLSLYREGIAVLAVVTAYEVLVTVAFKVPP